MSLNHELSELFLGLAALMELKGENVFKVIAFQKVGRILRDLSIDLKRCVAEGKVCEIEGIGKGSQQIIEEFVSTGKSTVFEEVAASVPAGLVPLMQIEGLGPKTIHLLWHERNITSLQQLEIAIDDGSLKTLKGIGAKKVAMIRQGVEAFKQRAAEGFAATPKRVGIADADAQALPVLAALRKMPQVRRAEIAGSLRRRKETVADLDFIAAAKSESDGPIVTEAFSKLPGVIQVVGCGATKCSVKLANGIQADLRIVPEENFGAAMLYFTGSKEHNVKIRGLALKRGLTLNEWGIYPLDQYEKAAKKTAAPPQLTPTASKTETDIYNVLGLAFIEPELREDRGEVDQAARKTLPTLISSADYRGDLHCHTTASDGTASIEEMIEAAIARNYAFIAITDHSKTQAIAGGLSVEKLLAHVKAIRKAAERYKKQILVLPGAEVDILADGRLDYEDALLAELDVVVASPHVSLKQDAAKATDRLVRAIESRYVHIIGHPTGRLINGRAGLPLEFPRIYAAAARSGTVLEINAGYPRLDLNDVNARGALEAGVRLAIDTDAHSTEGLDEIGYGLGVARRAGATAENVINCLTAEKLQEFLKRKRL